MLAINRQEMAQLPESLTEVKEYCSHCGKVLSKESTYVKAVIEQVSKGSEAVLIDCDERYFCRDCLKRGVCVNVRNPEH